MNLQLKTRLPNSIIQYKIQEYVIFPTSSPRPPKFGPVTEVFCGKYFKTILADSLLELGKAIFEVFLRHTTFCDHHPGWGYHYSLLHFEADAILSSGAQRSLTTPFNETDR